MADRYLLEAGAPDGYQLEDGSGVLLLDSPVCYRDVILSEPGLVAYWRFGEASGNPQDAKGTNHVDTIGGTPTYGVAGALSGDADTAVTLNGTTGYFQAPDANPLDIGGGPGSWEFWIKRSANGAVPVSDKGSAWDIGFTSGNQFKIESYTTAFVVASESGSTTDTNWHYFVITRSTFGVGNTKVYKDGADVTAVGPSIDDPDLLVNASPVVLGSNQAHATFFPGSIDEFAIYNVVLTPSQVATHYAAVSASCPLHASRFVRQAIKRASVY